VSPVPSQPGVQSESEESVAKSSLKISLPPGAQLGADPDEAGGFDPDETRGLDPDETGGFALGEEEEGGR
jgi:hypothetical protein